MSLTASPVTSSSLPSSSRNAYTSASELGSTGAVAGEAREGSSGGDSSALVCAASTPLGDPAPGNGVAPFSDVVRPTSLQALVARDWPPIRSETRTIVAPYDAQGVRAPSR